MGWQAAAPETGAVNREKRDTECCGLGVRIAQLAPETGGWRLLAQRKPSCHCSFNVTYLGTTHVLSRCHMQTLEFRDQTFILM